MRLTVCLYKISRVREMRNMYKHRGFVRPIQALPVWYLQNKEVVDPNKLPDMTTGLYMVRDEKPIDRKLTYSHPYNVTEHQDYHRDDYVYEFNTQTRLLEGLNQACILTKTIPRFKLPQAITEKIGTVEIPHQDELVQRVIMQANVWDPTKEKLPRRINKQIPGWRFKAECGIPQSRIRNLMVSNLLRLCQSINGRYQDLLLNRDFIEQPFITAHYTLFGEKRIMIRGGHDWLMTSTRPLEPFATVEEVDESAVEGLADLGPISPVIDLVHQHVYVEDEYITGYHGNYAYSHPHTMYLTTKDHLPPEVHKTRTLMFLFGHCLATAKARFGVDVKELPEPITAQAITTDGIRFLLACFQLNTLDFSRSSGVKNLVWFDEERAMYNKILPKRAMLRNTKYEDYDPEVFRRLMAMYLTGADMSVRERKRVEQS